MTCVSAEVREETQKKREKEKNEASNETKRIRPQQCVCVGICNIFVVRRSQPRCTG